MQYQTLHKSAWVFCKRRKNLPHTKSLFVFFIPTSLLTVSRRLRPRPGSFTYHNHHEHRTDTALKEPEEESLSINFLVSPASRRADQTDTPDSDNGRSNALDWEPLRQSHGRIRSDNETEVEYGRSHGVAVSDRQLQVLAETEDGLSPTN